MNYNQHIIDCIRKELNLPDHISDNEIWHGTKDSFMYAKIDLGIQVKNFAHTLKKAMESL